MGTCCRDCVSGCVENIYFLGRAAESGGDWLSCCAIIVVLVVVLVFVVVADAELTRPLSIATRPRRQTLWFGEKRKKAIC